MLLLPPVQNGKLIKNHEFVKLIGCGKTRFQAPISFPQKNVSLLFNEQSPIKTLKAKNVNNVRFHFLIAPTTDW